MVTMYPYMCGSYAYSIEDIEARCGSISLPTPFSTTSMYPYMYRVFIWVHLHAGTHSHRYIQFASVFTHR